VIDISSQAGTNEIESSPSTHLPLEREAYRPSTSQPYAAKKNTHLRLQGPTILEQVISKTRPSHLPPKAKSEDLKHIADWEAMMRQSRAIGDLLDSFRDSNLSTIQKRHAKLI
jgi:TBC1 domain family member 14